VAAINVIMVADGQRLQNAALLSMALSTFLVTAYLIFMLPCQAETSQICCLKVSVAWQSRLFSFLRQNIP
jgi:hypothetical protein